ncbi:putative enzyme related to lactoylglutathione lyase [Angulomicrobium tetraedrale]|uniref:Putative enzyme related to lactoylglutathione lyase n=1 Tax=Ancylobacter tetraedralis TaxID=217068 RepID=A0A839Z8Q2_9HYPH|nr:VOC family protein [Ancylobacter tetraedralis]MBB3771186.1 putative enzyme related to lactoylglutathione lyase [Ancylobacter tetraedralis]
MTVKKLHNVYVGAGDMAASRQFYEQVLGLTPKFADGERWVQYDAGGVNFAIGSSAEYPGGAAGAVAVFEVDDLDARQTELSAAGIRILAARDMGSHGRTVTLVDPSGNYLQLFQRRGAS